MRFVSLVVLALQGVVLATPIKRTVSQSVYDDLTFYFKYASSSYADSCPRPNGNTLVSQFSNKITDTQGYVARDDSRKEIVVALRGSSSTADAITDISIILVPLITGNKTIPGANAHVGFLTAWNSVSSQVLSTVKAQLAAHPDYSLVTSGHSLGGALSSLAAVGLKLNFPNTNLRMFTYGQPRTGDSGYASFVNSNIPSTFRAVHTSDGVPTLIPRLLGYKHHAFEYWQSPDPPSPSTTKKCAASGEDPTCSNSIPSTGINAAHSVYFGISSNSTFCS
jgi:predicted lipase